MIIDSRIQSTNKYFKTAFKQNCCGWANGLNEQETNYVIQQIDSFYLQDISKHHVPQSLKCDVGFVSNWYSQKTKYFLFISPFCFFCFFFVFSLLSLDSRRCRLFWSIRHIDRRCIRSTTKFCFCLQFRIRRRNQSYEIHMFAFTWRWIWRQSKFPYIH